MPFNPTSDDPFADPKDTDHEPEVLAVTASPTENWVSFNFNSDPGYDKIFATVHGTPEFVADSFAIENFDGKISTLMKRAVEVDRFFKNQYKPGKS